MKARPLPEGAQVLHDGKVRYELRWPITYQVGNEQQTLSHVTIRRKIYADNLAIKAINNPVDIGFALIQRLCGLEEPLIEAMDDADSEAIGAIIESFTQPGPRMPTSAPGS